jgi:glycerophosphoryl diester phosphodiesterase
MTKIIAHRGSAGSYLENSSASLSSAIAAQTDMIEFDVRLTADDKLVVIHDPRTGRVAAQDVLVRSKTLAELKGIKLHNGEPLRSLDEALDIIGKTPVIIEVKDEHSIDELLMVLSRHKEADVSIASFHPDEIRQLRRALPAIPTYILEFFSPFDIVQTAHKVNATGIGLNFWLMNPLTYRLARYYGLEVYVYVNTGELGEWLMVHTARLIRLLYPKIHLCTRYPERFANVKWRST